MDKIIIREILSIRWTLKSQQTPKRKWRNIIFENLWNNNFLKGKPIDTFTDCWDYLIEQNLI